MIAGGEAQIYNLSSVSAGAREGGQILLPSLSPPSLSLNVLQIES